MKTSTTTVIWFCLLALTGPQFSPTASAQVTSSELTGTVTDSSSAAVSGAKVTIRSKDTGFTRTVSTNDAGQYTIAELPPGAYDITVEKNGFKKATVADTNLYVGRTSTQDLELQVGALAQTITVAGQAPLLDTSNGQQGTVVSGPVVNQLPLNGRNFMQLGMLSPGTIVNKNGANAVGATYSPSAIVWSVNGHATNYNWYTLDGVDIKDFEDGPTTFQPSVEAIQEFQSTTSNYSAIYGTEATAQVNLVTKSGTNQTHGTAFEFLRNNALDAANFFQNGPAPNFKRNQPGGNIGGPVILPHYNGRDQTFFFFNYETYRQVRLVPETAEYPTLAELEGNLSDLVPSGQLINPLTGTTFAGSGPSDWFLGGWQLNGITTAYSGSPLTATQVFNIDNSDVGSNRPDAIGNPNGLSHSRARGQQVAEFFAITAFQQADLTNGTYRFGNEGRNTIIGPGTYDWDFALFKNFQFRERLHGQFRCETFNIFNRPIFAQPNSELGSPAYGAISSTSTNSREIQLGIRLTF